MHGAVHSYVCMYKFKSGTRDRDDPGHNQIIVSYPVSSACTFSFCISCTLLLALP